MLTKDEFLQLAREAGIEVHERKQQARIGSAIFTGGDSSDQLMRFAELIEARALAATLATVTPLVQQLSEWKEGDRVTGDFHHGQAATITKVFVGFHYELDEPHDLGPRHGSIKTGTVYDTSGWRKLPDAADAVPQPAQAGADRAGG